MKPKSIIAMSILAMLSLLSIGPMQTTAESAGYGPRSDLQIFSFPSGSSVFSSLLNGEIDIMGVPLTPSQYWTAVADPNILLAPVAKLDVYAFSLNNNDTIAAYPGVKNPLSYHPDPAKAANFRQAIHRLCNKEYFVNTICNGFAIELPVPIAAPSRGWWNPSVVAYVNTWLRFSITGAQLLLADAGFTDTDGDGILNYPPGWPGALGRPNLYPIKFYIRNDDSLMRDAALDLGQMMISVGIPTDMILAPLATCYAAVILQRNYHIYTASWNVERFPTYLYTWFHSSRWFSGGSNYHLSTTPRYSDIDEATESLWFPPSFEAAYQDAQIAQYLLMQEHTVIVPLWSTRGFYAYSSDLLGLVNMEANGIVNEYTYLRAWRQSGGPLRVGLTPQAMQVNQIYSIGASDLAAMNPFMADLLNVAPKNIMVDQPWLVKDWSAPPDTWLDGGVQKSKMTYWFRDDPNDGLGDRDAEWIEPITGDALEDFTPQWLEGRGYEFNCWYYASEPGGAMYTGYRDIHHIRIYPAERKAEVYFNTMSYWSMYWAHGRLIYAPAWKQAPLSELKTRFFAGPIAAGTSLSLPYKTTGAPVEIAGITRSDGQQYSIASGAYDNDYEMVAGKILLYTAIPAGVTITVQYWARGDPSGYAPGGIYYPSSTIGETWIGTGHHYVTEHVAGIGGWTTYKKNPHFFLETPPITEVNFWWNWVLDEPKPRAGYFMVDTLDLTVATWSLDAQGYAVPSPHWQPDMDVVQFVHPGLITVHDLTLIASSEDFGKIFGSTLP